MNTIEAKEGDRIHLLGNDRNVFSVDKRSLCMFNIEGLDLEKRLDDTYLNLNGVPDPVILDVVSFLDHYIEEPMPAIPMPIPTETHIIHDLVGDWYFYFLSRMKLDHEMMVLTVAGKLKIQPLIDLCCAHFAITMNRIGSNQVSRICEFTPRIRPNKNENVDEE